MSWLVLRPSYCVFLILWNICRGHAWKEFQQVKREEVRATVDPRMLQNPVPVHGPTRQVAPAKRQNFQEGNQATTLTANSWGHFATTSPSMWLNRQFPASIQHSSSSTTLPIHCASICEPRGLADISLPISLPNSNVYHSHESILESLCNHIPSSTQFQSGQMSSGPTFSNFVSPSISPGGSDASTVNPAWKDVEQFDRTISSNGSLFGGFPWAGGETRMRNPGVSGQQTYPHHLIYDQPQGAPAVDLFNVSNTPYQVDASASLPIDSRPTHLLGFPVSYDPSPPLTTAEKEWILSIALEMRASELEPEWSFEGPSFLAAPDFFEQDQQNTGGPSRVLSRQTDFAFALEHQPGSSSTVDQLPLVNSLRTLYEQRPPTSDLGSLPHSVPVQSAAQSSTDPSMFINFPLQTDYQPTFITPSSELNTTGSSEKPTRIVRRNMRKRRLELELGDDDNQDAQYDGTSISVTCEWDGCGEQLVSMEGFKEHFVKSGTGASKHDLLAGNNSKEKTTCLWRGCHRPIACLWRHLWEVHGGFPRQQKRRRL